ncbi:hypothetical protein [Spiroplasma endosymbiont of Lariophagus distinguendus]|uniref:hypothetical protein n=1 Tax=Spiroplasma endosymbiont of Lariophagus distinguendus TaxID=2935082 RepID=UPI00207A3A6D|nr:hypothetical protein [Spiroplasma endosymbiont of Lariophagus distinguendus]
MYKWHDWRRYVLTSNNWDYLYEYYINELQLENFKGEYWNWNSLFTKIKLIMFGEKI